MASVNRRTFIKIGGAAAGAVALSGLTSRWWGADRDPVQDPGSDGDRVVPTFCELCYWKCGVLAHVKDGRVTKITGNPDHPLSRGRLCPRGAGGTGLLYDPDRLKKPLVRRHDAERGEDVFDEVEWDVALDLIAEKMLKLREEHGPEALALFTHGWGGKWIKHLIKAYGSPNVAGPSYAQCKGPREAAYQVTFGSIVGSPEAIDIRNTRCLTLIGSHLGENMHNTQVQDMAHAIDNGAELVVVDPRFSVAAGKARYWLPIKPGGDLALLLAWMNVIIGEDRYDKAYIDEHAVGFDRLAEHVSDKTPEWAYAHTGLEPGLIRETARFISSFKPSSLIHPGRHTVRYGDDTQRNRAKAILAALLGSYGHRGGYIVPSAMDIPDFPYTAYPTPELPKIDRPDEFAYPLADHVLASGLCDVTIPGTAGYDIKAWLVYGTNLIQSLPNPAQTIKAIQALDFMVAIDVMPAEICGWADVVLPEATYLERCDELWAPYNDKPFVAVRQKVVEPMYDTKPGWWIAKELAHRIGLADYFPWKDSEEYAKHRVEAAGLSCEELQTKGVILGEPQPTTVEEGLGLSFDTPSGKVELYSETLEQLGFDPMPVFRPHAEPPPGHFRLIFGRSPVHSFSRTTNNRVLSSVHPENDVWINTSAAKALPAFADRPLKTGDKIVLINQDGVRSDPVSVRVTERIRGDCVYMVHGFGLKNRRQRRSFGKGASDARLITRYAVDPLMGGTGMNVNFVRVERAEEQA